MTAAIPISRRTTADRVADEVRRQIWAGEFRSGDHLNQEDIAAALGVSRIPVREALITLAHEGTIEMAPHKGAHVAPLTEQTVIDHYDLFAQIDGFALQRAIARSSAAVRAELAAVVDQTTQAVDVAAMHAETQNTRAMIYELGGSPRLRAVARGLSGLVPGNFFAQVPGTMPMAQQRLPLVAAAVRANNPVAAVKAYAELMNGHAQLVTATLRERGVLVIAEDAMETP